MHVVAHGIHLAYWLALAMLATQTWAADTAALPVQIQAQAAPRSVFPGEPVRLIVQVRNYEPDMGSPMLPDIPAAVSLVHQQDRNEHSVRIVNGVQQVTRFSGRVFEYRIVPEQSGVLALGPIQIQDTQGQQIVARGPSITVKQIPVQDHVMLWIEGPQTPIVPDQRFSVTLWIRIRRLARPYAQSSPIPQGGAPLLHIPYLDWPAEVGIESPGLMEHLQQNLVSQGEAFRINNRILAQNALSLFQREQPAWFRLEREIDPDNDEYFRYHLTTEWIATRKKTFTFGPASFKGPVITNVSAQGQADIQEFYAVSDPLQIQVAPPPSTNRPANWIGAAGRQFRIQTALDTQTCFVGDPLALTIDITGETARHRIRAPNPDTLAALADTFRIVGEPQTEELSNGKRFTYLLRPQQSGTQEIPALEISYFDLDTQTYESLRSQPLPVRVNAVTNLGAAAVFSGTEHTQAYGTNGTQRLSPAPIRMPASRTFRLYAPIGHTLLLLAGPFLLLLSVSVRFYRKQAASRSRVRACKQAARTAQHQLKQALASEQPCSPSDLASILRSYLSDRFEKRLRAATAADIQTYLADRNVSPELARHMAEHLRDDVYARRQTARAEQIRQVQDLIHSIDHTSVAPPRKHHGIQLICTLLVLSLAMELQAQPQDARRSFEARRAQATLAQANTPEEFLVAAEAQAARIAHGYTAPEHFYHLGTALLLAGHPRLAMPALLRAERRGGSRWDIRRNLLLAIRAVHDDPTRALPWYRTPLFWHYRLGIPARITVASLLLAGLWGIYLLRFHGYHHTARLRIPLLILFLLFCGSLSAALYAEWQAASQHARLRNQIEHLIAQTREDPPS